MYVYTHTNAHTHIHMYGVFGEAFHPRCRLRSLDLRRASLATLLAPEHLPKVRRAPSAADAHLSAGRKAHFEDRLERGKA